MSVNIQAYQSILSELQPSKITLVAVSKTKPIEDLRELYDLGQKDFGENYVQELVDKHASLPADIRWHFIGHLQSNKVKLIAPFVHLIHGVDSAKLLSEINKQGIRNNRIIPCLLQIHIAQEETKFGLDEPELKAIFAGIEELSHTAIVGLMGMASFTDDVLKVQAEFRYLNSLFKQYFSKFQPLPQSDVQPILSMGMSGDYIIAMKEGSTMVRIGSLLFGARN